MDRLQNKIKKEHIGKRRAEVSSVVQCILFLDLVLSLFAVTFQVHSPPSVLTTKNR